MVSGFSFMGYSRFLVGVTPANLYNFWVSDPRGTPGSWLVRHLLTSIVSGFRFMGYSQFLFGVTPANLYGFLFQFHGVFPVPRPVSLLSARPHDPGGRGMYRCRLHIQGIPESRGPHTGMYLTSFYIEN